jgi:membrane-associated phospholipid phosphatase
VLTGTAQLSRWKLDRESTWLRPRIIGEAKRPPLRVALIVGLSLFYAVLTAAVVTGSDFDGLDTIVLRWALSDHTPWLHHFLSWWVLLGQRGICLGLAAPWLAWRTLRHRDIRPLLTFAVVTLVMNVTVGAVKLTIGRLGPLQLGTAAIAPGASRVFTDGTIFPSGHTANAVVTWGLIAMLARQKRPLWGAASAFIAASVGLTTIYLGTHWVSDVLAGWAAGGLVLLAVPALMPVVDRAQRLVNPALPASWLAPQTGSPIHSPPAQSLFERSGPRVAGLVPRALRPPR